MSKIPVYFMPGMAASSRIFERIQLDSSVFELYFLEWITPCKDESLRAYSQRLAQDIHHANPVLIGVSFGGLVVQELQQIIPVRQTIIISSVRCNEEFPSRIRFARATKIYKLFPTRWLPQIEHWGLKWSSAKLKKKMELYSAYLSIRDPLYLDWAFEKVITWDRNAPDPSVIHIQGDQDEVFPLQHIKDAIVVQGGTHAMILFKYKWFNEHLNKLILNDNKERVD